MNWYEQLPSQCPPSDAVPCNGIFYRIAHGNPAANSDFFSQKRLKPDKIFTGFGIDDCIVRSVSLFSDIDDAAKRLKLPKFRHANVAEVILTPKDGLIKKTFFTSHYSWWRTTDFHVSQAKIISL